MYKSSGLIKTIVEVALFAALGFVFDELQSVLLKGVFIAGGSIGFAMIAVVVVSFRRGTIAGFATGLIMGLLDLSTGPYILNFWQVLFDYIFPYCFVALCCLFVPWFNIVESKGKRTWILVLAVAVGGLGKFLSHYLSGVLFFTDQSGFAFNLTNTAPWLYSLIYNIAYMGPCIVLTAALAAVINLRVPKVFERQNIKETIVPDTQVKAFDYVLKPTAMAVGITMFVYFLIKYIRSYEGYEDFYNGNIVYGAEFNPDYLMLYITGALLVLFTTISILSAVLNKRNYRLIMIVYAAISFDNIIYALARIGRLCAKKKAVKYTVAEHLEVLEPYWKWFFIALAFTVLFVVIYLLIKEKASKKEAE